MFKFNKNLSLFKSTRLVFEGPETPKPTKAPESEDPALTPAEHAKERAKTTKEILEGVKQDRAALSNKQDTALTLETKEDRGDKLLMENTYVLIAQRGTGSKHNERGWKGLALATDSVKVLDRQVKLINGVEMVKVKLSHKLYTKPGAKDRYRTYIGYIPKKSFDPSVRLRAPEPEDRKWKERPEESKPKPVEVKNLTADFFLKHGAKSAIDHPHDFAIFGKKIHCDLQLLYGAGIYDRLLVKIKENPKTKNPILEVYSPVNIKVKDSNNTEQSMEEIAFLGNFLPTTANIKNFVSIMKSHKQKRIERWTEKLKNSASLNFTTEERTKVKPVYNKFTGLINKYPDKKGLSCNYREVGENMGLYSIKFFKMGHEIVNILLNVSKEPFEYTVNNQAVRNIEHALQFAKLILKREVGSPEETEE